MRGILDSRYATTNDVTHTHIYIEFIYRVYRFRPCILNSYDTLWLRNAIFLRLSIESTITLQLVNRGAMRLRCSNLMVWTGYYGLQRPIHRGRKAFRRIVANNRGWVTTKSAPLLSATRLPLVRLETCAPPIGAYDCACAVAVRRPRWRQPARRGSTLAMVRAVKGTFSRLFAEERRGLRSQPGPCTSLYTAAMKAIVFSFT